MHIGAILKGKTAIDHANDGNTRELLRTHLEEKSGINQFILK
jgi:hypothetical protein